MLKPILTILILVAGLTLCKGAEPDSSQVVVYLFPGQGADYRQYRDLSFPEGYDTVHISYPVPEKRERMAHFARRFIPLIDTTRPYILVGVSLGGMICTELADVLHPKKVILISSAKTAFELPGRYTFMGKTHLNRIIPKGLVKAGARTLQGLVEPDRKYDPETFKDMLKKKDAAYLKRTADMIVNWERDSYLYSIIHIHGDADHTIPFKNVSCEYAIKDGSHMMVLSRAEEISRIFAKILKER
jgi:pimeloyl-ACP methyl ester carboxylesterase